jgi:hypothetical protein
METLERQSLMTTGKTATRDRVIQEFADLGITKKMIYDALEEN